MENRVKEYFVLEAGSAQELQEMVNTAIKKENEHPYAGPFTVVGQGGPRFCQVVVFFEGE